MEAAESEGEEGWGGEEGGEAAEVAVEEGGDGVAQMRNSGRWEIGERGHDHGFWRVDVVCHLREGKRREREISMYRVWVMRKGCFIIRSKITLFQYCSI